jgi:hypothetical protein
MRLATAILALTLLAAQEGDQRITSCTNDGKKGTFESPHDCSCFMACAKAAGSTDPQQTEHDRRCKTYCRAHQCSCKPPCL